MKTRTIAVALQGLDMELRKTQEWEAAGGYGYSARIFLSGVDVGYVEQRGDGGSNLYLWTDRDARATVESAAKAAIPSMLHEQLDAVINGALDGCTPAQVDAFMRGDA